jgi:hypothetical protein
MNISRHACHQADGHPQRQKFKQPNAERVFRITAMASPLSLRLIVDIRFVDQTP